LRKHDAFSPDLRLALVRTLREVSRDAEADEAARGGTGDVSRNTSIHRLRVWVAVEAAIAGEAERSRVALESVDPVLLDGYHRQVRRLARALLEVQCAPPEGRASAIKSAVERVERAARDAKLKKADAALRRIFRRAVNRLSRECGRPVCGSGVETTLRWTQSTTLKLRIGELVSE